MKVEGYECLDGQCPKRWCWSPGSYQHRGATGSGGSRNTGSVSRQCLERAYRGCPDPLPAPGQAAPWDDDDGPNGVASPPARRQEGTR